MITRKYENIVEIDIVITCYNQANFLGDAINSALSQTRPARDIIVVDDGSTDDTQVIAARYASVRYIKQENSGLSAARNTGLSISSGQFVLFLDSDDVLEPNTLEIAAPVLMENRNQAFVYGGYREVSENRTTLAVYTPVQTESVFNDLLKLGNFIAMHGTVLYDAEILRLSGGFDTALSSCEDFDVYLRLSRDHHVSAYSSIAAEYRRHGESLSRNTLRMIETSRFVLERHSRTPSERTEARQGLTAMTAYYGNLFWLSVTKTVRQRQVWASIGILVQLIGRPRLWASMAAHAPLSKLWRRAH